MGVMSYEQGVHNQCTALQGVLEGCLVPQGVAPAAAAAAGCQQTTTSGTAVCQVVLPLSERQQQTQHTGCCTLPELQQMVDPSHPSVEVHFLPISTPSSGGQPVSPPQQQEDQQQPQQAASEPPGRSADTTSDAPTTLHAFTSSCDHRSSSGGGEWGHRRRRHRRQQEQPNSWMHADLQRYLFELEPSQWTASAAAAAAFVVTPSAAAAALSAAPEDTPATGVSRMVSTNIQHNPAADALLQWMAAVHNTAIAHSSSSSSSCCSQGVTQKQQQLSWPLPTSACTWHPNIQPVLHVATTTSNSSNSSSSSSNVVCVLTDHIATDAAALLRHSPAALGGDWHLRFLLYQLLHALSALHSKGFALGGFTLDQLRLVSTGWVQLMAKPSGQLQLLPGFNTAAPAAAAAAGIAGHQQPQQQLQGQRQQLQHNQWQLQQQQRWRQGPMLVSQPYYTLPQLTDMWRRRVISNFEYLMWVNAAAGRRWGDRQRHPYLPWVLDFSTRPVLDAQGRVVMLPSADATINTTSSSTSSSSPPPGWRDLGVSQYRQIKGDPQLDQTYAMSAAAAAAAGAGPNGPWSGCVAGSPGAAAGAVGMDPWGWSAWDGSSSSGTGVSSAGGGVDAAAAGGGGGGAGGGGASVAAAAPVQPHHISNEPMSELSYAIYMARRLPLELLVQLVRRSFRPEEYPASLQGLYSSSPDEALPQFYCDPSAFVSTHEGMRDLAVPGWARDAEDFVRLHRAALESDYVSANLHKWLDLSFGVCLSGAAGLAAKNIHLGSTDSSSSSSKAAGGGCHLQRGVVVPGVEPCCRGVYQLFHLPHPARSTRTYDSSSSSGSSRDSAAVAAATAAAAAAEAGPEVAISGGGGSLGGEGEEDGVPALEACWAELASLEAAAAAGAWVPGAPVPAHVPAAAAAADVTTTAAQLAAPTAAVERELPADASSSSSSSHSYLKLLPADAAAADLAALGQVALQLYTKQQQEIALGASAGHHAAEQCWQYCSSSSGDSCSTAAVDGGLLYSSRGRSSNTGGARRPNSSSVGSALFTGSKQTGGRRPPGVPPAVSLFVQQCGSGAFTAEDLLSRSSSSSFLPSWMGAARQFMVQLLFRPAVVRPAAAAAAADGAGGAAGVVTPAAAADGAAGGDVITSSQPVGASQPAPDAWQLSGDAFQSLTQLAVPGGALDQLAASPQALQVCLPAILHVVRGRLLLHGGLSTELGAAAAEDTTTQWQQQQQHQQQDQGSAGEQLLNAACVVLFRLASVLSQLQVQQHLVPLLAALLSADAEEGISASLAATTQEHQARSPSKQPPPSPHAAAAAPAGSLQQSEQQQQHLDAHANSANSSSSAECVAAAAEHPQCACPAAVRVAVGRRAVLQPALWHLLATKLPQQVVLGVLLPPLLASLLDSAAADSRPAGDGHDAASVKGVQQPQQQWQYYRERAATPAAATQSELACSCLAVLAECLPFPVVAQHILRPLMLALPSGSTLSSSSNATRAAVSPAFLAACGLLSVARVLPEQLVEEFMFRPLLQMALLPLKAAQSHSVTAAVSGAVGGSGGTNSAEAGNNTVGQLTLTALPVLEGLLLCLLPVLKAETLLPSFPASAGGGAAAAAVGSPPAVAAAPIPGAPPNSSSSSSSNSLQLPSAASTDPASTRPVVSLSRNSSLQHQSYAGAVSSGPAAAPGGATAAGAAAGGSVRPLSAGSSTGVRSRTAAALWHMADLLLLLPPDAVAISACPLLYPRVAALLLLGMDCAVQQQAQASAVTSSNASATANSGGAGGGSIGSTSPVAASSAAAVSGAQAVAAAAAGGDAANGAAASRAREQLVAVYRGWLLPSVLQPLVGLQGTTAWGITLAQAQQEQQLGAATPQQQYVQRAYWRTVLLVYAAAVHVLGLAAVRAAVPDWHSVEVWLLAETGWEPEQAALGVVGSGEAAPAQGSAATGGTTPTLQLLGAMAHAFSPPQPGSSPARNGLSQKTAAAAANTQQQLPLSCNLSPAVLQQVGLLAALPSAGAADHQHGLDQHHTNTTSGGGGVHSLLLAQGAASAAAGAGGGMRMSGGGASGSNSGSSSHQIAGRVTHLLQRIAEEKVVRRSLNTTHEFLEGVGWSLPRPTTPSGAGAGVGVGGGTISNPGGGTISSPGSTAAALRTASSSGSQVDFTVAQQQSVPAGGGVGGAGAAGLPNRKSLDGAVDRSDGALSSSSSSANGNSKQQAARSMHRTTSAPASGTTATAAAAAAATAAVAVSAQQPDVGSSGVVSGWDTSAAAAAAAELRSALQQQQLAGGARDPADSSANSSVAAAISPELPSATVPLQNGAATTTAGHSWAAELSQLRSLLETPTRTTAGERGPSAGKEWFWLRNNSKLDVSHLVPDFSHFPSATTSASNSNTSSPQSFGSWYAAAGGGASSSRPWHVPGGMWWEEGWRLGAVCLHSWPAHRERLRALAVDPWERLLVTAGRGGTREASGSSSGSGSNWVVRVWELADAEAKVQYAAHTAAVHQVAFLGPCSPVVASLDVSGAIHVWSRTSGSQLQAFAPVDLAESGAGYPVVSRPARSAQQFAAAAGSGSTSRGADDGGRLSAAAAAAASVGVAGGAAGAASSAAAGGGESGRRTAAVSGTAEAVAQASSGPGSEGFAAVASGSSTLLSGGYWERGCGSGRGWQALSALPTSQQLGSGASSSRGVSGAAMGAAGGVLDAAGGASAVLGGPGWPLGGGTLGYTCFAAVDANHSLVESSLLSGSSGASSSGGYSGSTLLLLAGTADGHVCLLDVETGALLEDSVACWDPRPWSVGSLSGSSMSSAAATTASNRGSLQQQQQQQLMQYQQQQPGVTVTGGLQASYPVLAPAGAPAVLGAGSGWDGLSIPADPSQRVVSAVCYSSRGGGGVGAVGGWVGAGSGGGRITLLDMRAGMVVANWQAHAQRVSQLQALSGVQGVDSLLLSCSADKTMKLWDLRMMPQAAARPHVDLGFGVVGTSGSTSSGMAAPLVTYRSGREGIEGFVVYQDAAIVYGGGSIGLAPLDVAAAASASAASAGLPGSLAGQLQHQQGSGSVQMVRMTAVKGLGYRASSGVREGLGAVGSSSAVVGLGLLAHSKLLVVGTEDGLLRICR